MSSASTLLISHDARFCHQLSEVVGSIGNCDVRILLHVADAVPHLQDDRVAVAIVHLSPGDSEQSVVALLHEAAKLRSHVATVVVSDAYEPANALQMLRLGVADYLCSQRDILRLKSLVAMLTVRVRYLRQPSKDMPQQFPGNEASVPNPRANSQMATLMEQVRMVAAQDTHLLLRGETGTGKTRLARCIHDASARASRPFLIVNCASLSPSLTESELFGHSKGAFTGADRDRIGKFADAGEGTVLLDDVDTLSLDAQAKLLQVVDERVFEPVGSNRSQKMLARLIAATNRLLEEEVAAGRFRRDLYFRLNVIEIRLPPLRERTSEIGALAEHFVLQAAARAGRAAPRLAPEVVQAFESYEWWGNVRELRNVVERCVILAPGNEIQLPDLPDNVQFAAGRRHADAPNAITPSPAREASQHAISAQHPRQSADPAMVNSGRVAQIVFGKNLSVLATVRIQAEIRRIIETLERNGQNRSRAAQELGISRVALYKKLHRFGLMESPELG